MNDPKMTYVAGLYYAYGRLDSGGHFGDANEFARLYAESRTNGESGLSVQDTWANYVRVKASHPAGRNTPVQVNQINYHHFDETEN